LRFPYTSYVLAALIVFLGVSAIVIMPEDISPEINIPVVSLIWQHTGLSMPEMKQRLCGLDISGLRRAGLSI
jgi:multidrug efflux pump subunit AcrB